LKLATIGITVAIERDWVTVIAEGNSDHLTRLNTYIRRIDLLSKLLAPLFVSLLTTVSSYPLSVAVLLGFGMLGLIFEFICLSSYIHAPAAPFLIYIQ
jgi:iron-regulated transporter 1